MKGNYILAIDQGTSGSKAIIFDEKANTKKKAFSELKSYFPAAGMVEQDPFEIYQNVLDSVKNLVESFDGNIASCGISNQRETFLLCDKNGNPLSNAIVWQCKRSVDVCRRLEIEGLQEEIANRTGLIIDPYFSGTKLMWLYENDSNIRQAIKNGNAYFCTVDTWLLYQLTKQKKYLTDYTNACRTLFFNIDSLDWDEYLLKQFKLENLRLPEVRPSSAEFGETTFEGILARPVPIHSMIGDSHAAAFGEGCFSEGSAKATLGTGSSILMNTGKKRVKSSTGMVSTICWSMAGRTDYALEGIIVTCGATIKWIQNELGLFQSARDTEKIAVSVTDNNGVYLIPAFSGLGAPHWKMDSKAAILNLTFDCTKSHIVRAALESIPYQITDVITAMEKDSGISLHKLNVDGGITANRFVMQFLSNCIGNKVENIGIEEVSALGAAFLAGLQCGIFNDLDSIKSMESKANIFTPDTDRQNVENWYNGWLENVDRV